VKLIGMMLSKNGRWIVGASARAALSYCDEVVILDHASEDRMADVIALLAAKYPGRVTRLQEDNPIFDEMNLRDRLVQAARERGATHVTILDDDEIMTAPAARVIRERVERLEPGCCLSVPAPRIWGGLDAYQLPSDHYTDLISDMAFPITPETSYQPGPDGYQFHSRKPRGVTRQVLVEPDLGGYMHLQTASIRRYLAKQCWYKMIEIIRWPKQGVDAINARYDNTVYTWAREFKLALVPPSWWEGMEEVRAAIDLTSEPWQEAEAHKLWAEYGVAKFAGLDLYGVVRG
jgi:hypothetical protein